MSGVRGSQGFSEALLCPAGHFKGCFLPSFSSLASRSSAARQGYTILRLRSFPIRSPDERLSQFLEYLNVQFLS